MSTSPTTVPPVTASQSLALDMGAHALVHPIEYRSNDLSAAFVARMAASRAYQMTTFSVMDSLIAAYHPERFDEPLIALVAPREELAAARDESSRRDVLRSLVRDEGPWMPNLLRDLVSAWWFSERAQLEALRHSQRAVRRLYEAGVPIVLGSDTPFRQSIVYGLHGSTTLREIELLIEAGLAPAEALQASTRIPAEMLGLGRAIGTVEVGKRADLVVLRGDPLQDPRALWKIAWTVCDGVARTPAEWMGG